MRSDAVLTIGAWDRLVKKEALKRPLKEGRVITEAFDVFAVEAPKEKEMELLALSSFIVTPRVGDSSEEAVWPMGRATIEGFQHFADPKTAREG